MNKFSRRFTAGALCWCFLSCLRLGAQEQQSFVISRIATGAGSSSILNVPAISFTGPSPIPSLATNAVEAFEPVTSNEQKNAGVNWLELTQDSINFLAVMQSFRCATEPGTRSAFGGTSFFKGYIHAVENLHGFGDGDPFYVNYIGHPMQGAVSAAIWANNDRAYENVYFSRDKRYWKEKLRGGAFSYVYSVQFEIGPVSEASIGNVQSYYPAQGFVDHVVTPVVGMGWTIAEDVIDRYLVRSIEQQSHNRYVKLLARSAFNPARSFANIMGGKVPWQRTNRRGVNAETTAYYKPSRAGPKVARQLGVAPFEFKTEAVVKTFLGSKSRGSCVGGGAAASFRIAKTWQIAADVNGCKITNLPVNVSGDSLTYVIGPRWTIRLSPRWTSHAQLQLGGNKLTQEFLNPAKERLADQQTQNLAKMGINSWPPPYAQFAQSWDDNAFAITTGAGFDVKFNNALRLRTGLDYSHTWNDDINKINYRSSLQFSTGLVLTMGTW